MARKTKPPAGKSVETLRHPRADATRKNIPTAEYQSVIQKEAEQPLRVAYERRNRDLDPQLVWRGKDEQDWSDLVVQAPPLYIQEKVHPKALIEDLLRQTRERRHEAGEETLDLFADFNGIPPDVDRTDFYQHDQNWSNRMILGDSLQVMASLAEREGLRGKVQCIYIDPPYGIKFNSNFQWSTTSRDVKDGNAAHITGEPEQVKAFRLTESGSIFVQIGDENVHLIDQWAESHAGYAPKQSFPEMILDNLKTAGVQQAHKEGRITFTALTRRAAIFIGPEFGTVTRPDLVAAAREAGDAWATLHSVAALRQAAVRPHRGEGHQPPRRRGDEGVQDLSGRSRYTFSMGLLDRITRDPAVMGGRPCIRGMRVTVGTIVGLLAAGRTHDEVLRAYPYLEADDIRAVLSYAAWRTEEVELPFP